jgi:chorismate mutase/prephenate dehydratase
VFKVEHRPGSLCDMLKTFNGINILKLESRPLKDRPFEYLFHLDFEGSAEDTQVKRVLEDAKSCAADLIWLGSYPRMSL